MHRRCRNFVKHSENCRFSFAVTYKTELFSLPWFWKPQVFDLPGRFQENLAMVIIFGELQDITASVVAEFSRQHQELIANCLYRSSPVIIGQTQSLKPVDE